MCHGINNPEFYFYGTRGMDFYLSLFLSRVARFGRVKWKSFYRYAYCRMSGEGEGEGEKKKRSFQSTCIGCTVNRNINRYTSRPMRRFH